MINIETENKINEYTELFKKVLNEIYYIDIEIKEVNKLIENKEAEQDDLLHEIELAQLNAIERSRVFNKLKEVRQERRKMKDDLQVFRTVKPLVDILLTKGIKPEIIQTVTNLGTCKNNMKSRTYNAKIRKDLKCSKMKGETKE